MNLSNMMALELVVHVASQKLCLESTGESFIWNAAYGIVASMLKYLMPSVLNACI